MMNVLTGESKFKSWVFLSMMVLIFIGLSSACSPNMTIRSNESVVGIPTGISVSTISPGSLCPTGGSLIQTFKDLNANGILDADRGEFPINYSTACNGGNGASAQSPLVTAIVIPGAVGGSCGVEGGNQIIAYFENNTQTGYQVSGDLLVSQTDVCHGADGANGLNGTNGTNGSNGSNGTNGMTPLVTGTAVASGGVCGLATGTKWIVYFETNSVAGFQDGFDSKVSETDLCNGANGMNGSNGDDGANGSNGATWLSGPGAPNNGVGSNGDHYFDSLTSNIYLKSAGAWNLIANIAGSNGFNGMDGTRWFHDTHTNLANNTSTIVGALDGDYAVATDTGRVFKYLAGSWVDQGFNLGGASQGPMGCPAIPVAMTLIGPPGGKDSFCIDTNESPVMKNYREAILLCKARDAHLCHFDEWYTACKTTGSGLIGMTGGWEMVDELFKDYGATPVALHAMVVGGTPNDPPSSANTCEAISGGIDVNDVQPIAVDGSPASLYRYRCCSN